MIGRDDLKLKYMPSTLLNYLSQGHLPFDLMKTIHRTIRNFEGSVWEKKIKERGAYYTEIEDKVYEQLKVWEKDGGQNSKSFVIKAGEKSSKNDDTMPQPMNAKHLSTKQYTENADRNHVFETGDNINQAYDRLCTVAGIVSTLSAAIASVLYAMAFPESLPILAPAVLHDLSEALCTEKLLLAIILFSLFLPVTIFISLLAWVQTPHQNYSAREQDQSIDIDEVNKPKTPNSKCKELRSFVNSNKGGKDAESELETKSESVGLNNPKTEGNGRGPKTEATLGGLDRSSLSNDGYISLNDNSATTHSGKSIQEETISTQASGSREPKSSTQPPPHSKKRLRKVRSTLNSGLRGIKRA
eukprot:CAMPEP_0172566050 /NCGR_PEP_ID=MMETSP1067-20121228/110416_1 /TAXON_ID=265564 ORGANISM="Thalassiosira punctigera, Strain Tpunct2005C2" /NCGR_SAMPLE_ID=MMETSP1067 /ASSEMBLY_ACC=CAM_ASM_000444 /LENGTH=356 /DNA_ID=CAMNT_0013357071 /DNA_START=44 /DNA_END=1111 /DNA_ORIENTATION=-